MNRILLYCMFLGTLGACQNDHTETTVTQLNWPLLEEVTNIRSQLCASNGHYFLATDHQIYKLDDTSKDAQTKLLIEFPDSLWDQFTSEKYQLSYCKKPEEVDHDFVRNMPAFLIEKIQLIDTNSLLVFLAFNSLTPNPNREGSSLNHDIKTISLNISTGEMRIIPYDGYEELSYFDTLRYIYLHDPVEIVAVNNDNNLRLFTTGVVTYLEDSNSTIHNDMLGEYISAIDKFILHTSDSFKQSTSGYLNYLTDENGIYGIHTSGIEKLIPLDTTSMNGHWPQSVKYSGRRNKFFLLTYCYHQEDASYSSQLFLIGKNGKKERALNIQGLSAMGSGLMDLGNGSYGFFTEVYGMVFLQKISGL